MNLKFFLKNLKDYSLWKAFAFLSFSDQPTIAVWRGAASTALPAKRSVLGFAVATKACVRLPMLLPRFLNALKAKKGFC